MRTLAFASFTIALCIGSSACGVLAGLGGYAVTDSDGGLIFGPDVSSSGSTSPGGDDVAIMDEPPGDDVSPSDAGPDVVTPDDAETQPDSGLGPDARPPCTAATCPTGCCKPNGDCAGGQVDTSCGTEGNQCQDCTSSGEVCGSTGCAAPKPDASPPPPACSQSNTSSCKSCSNLQVKCCTSGVCGCQYYWPSSCQ